MCTVINRNRKKKLDMKRVFAQGRFRRLEAAEADVK
jgi:hypothetical protein